MHKKRYRLYIDESGDHAYPRQEGRADHRYLGLVGVIFDAAFYAESFHKTFEDFKQRFFPYNPDEPIIFHREELVSRSGPFWRLRDDGYRQTFNHALIDLFKSTSYSIISVVIDKTEHFARYQESALHPYHYCLVAMLERYCGLLNFYNAEGDVMAESRGGKEDTQLKGAYIRAYEDGTSFRDADFFQKALTTKEIKIKKKSANIAGLQFADLLARPCKNDILLENNRINAISVFEKELCRTVQEKFNKRSRDGEKKGYGKIFLG